MYFVGAMEHAKIISLWPSIAAFADDIGVSENTAKQMRTRNRVNAKYWPAMVAGAQVRGIKGVTLEALAKAISEAAA
jgi:hypothetical protein